MSKKLLVALAFLHCCYLGAAEIYVSDEPGPIVVQDFGAPVQAAEPPLTLNRRVMNELQFPREDDHVFTVEEIRALEMSEELRCQDIEVGYNPSVGPDGAIRYMHGSVTPVVICSVLKATAIELEEGEVINDVNIGDSVRWSVGEMLAGKRSLVTVKPAKNGLETTLIIGTDRRGYYITLKSDSSRWMSKVCFAYPDDARRKWGLAQKAIEEERANKTFNNGVYGGDLDFSYEISGNAPWKPLRVYNDGQKTFIDMPKSIQYESLPVLKSNNIDRRGLIDKRRSEIVNYRYEHELGRFIADQILTDASLISGTGSNRRTIRMVYTPERRGRK